MIEVRNAIFSGELMHTALAEYPMRAQKAIEYSSVLCYYYHGIFSGSRA